MNILRGMEDKLQAAERSRQETEDRLRQQVSSHTSLTTKNAKLTSQIHSLNNQITEQQAVSRYTYTK